MPSAQRQHLQGPGTNRGGSWWQSRRPIAAAVILGGVAAVGAVILLGSSAPPAPWSPPSAAERAAMQSDILTFRRALSGVTPQTRAHTSPYMLGHASSISRAAAAPLIRKMSECAGGRAAGTLPGCASPRGDRLVSSDGEQAHVDLAAQGTAASARSRSVRTTGS